MTTEGIERTIDAGTEGRQEEGMKDASMIAMSEKIRLEEKTTKTRKEITVEWIVLGNPQ